MKNRFDKIVDEVINISFGLFISSTLAAVVMLVLGRFNLLKKLPIEWVFAVGYLIAFIILLVLKKLKGTKGYEKIRHVVRILFYKAVSIVRAPTMGIKYTKAERSTKKYKQAIELQIKNSNRMYFRLLSGYTMFYDDREKFILKSLEDVFKKDKDSKNIKIQLMDRTMESFEERGRSFVDLMGEKDMSYKCSYEEYLGRCETIERNLKEIVGEENVSLYKRKYLWRLHIFDDKIFISTYSDLPELIEGHLSSAYAFSREYDPILFDGFCRDFESLYKNKNATN